MRIAVGCLRRSLHFAVRKSVGLEVGVVLLGCHGGGCGDGGGGRMCMGVGWVVGEEERCKKREGKGRRRGVYSRSDVSFQ